MHNSVNICEDVPAMINIRADHVLYSTSTKINRQKGIPYLKISYHTSYFTHQGNVVTREKVKDWDSKYNVTIQEDCHHMHLPIIFHIRDPKLEKPRIHETRPFSFKSNQIPDMLAFGLTLISTPPPTRIFRPEGFCCSTTAQLYHSTTVLFYHCTNLPMHACG